MITFWILNWAIPTMISLLVVHFVAVGAIPKYADFGEDPPFHIWFIGPFIALIAGFLLPVWLMVGATIGAGKLLIKLGKLINESIISSN